jgi:putative endonuclease
MKDWFMYVLLCADGSYYCGITNDVKRRVFMHNRGRGAKYTRATSKRPVKVIFTVGPFFRSDAAKLECRFKRVRRSGKEEFMRLEGKLWNQTQAANEVLLTHARLPKE